MKGYLSTTIWQKSVLAIDNVLEVLNNACIKWVKIYFAVHDSK